MAFSKAVDRFGNEKDYGGIGSSILVTTGSQQAYGGRSFSQLNFGFTINQTGNSALFTRNANGTVTLAAGYRYRVFLRLQVRSGTAWTSWRFEGNGANLYNRIYMSSGFNGASSVNGREHVATFIFDASASTVLAVKNWEGDSASTWTFSDQCDMLIEVLNVL